MSHLVAMTKNGETLGIHPDLVRAHEHLGWTIGGELPAADALRDDGPTVAEYVAAGYQASAYPPEGYASRSTPEEIAAAVAAQVTNGKIELGADSGDGLSDEELRAAIETATGQKPHHLLGRAKLVEQFNELNAKAAKDQAA